jgi:hypothetical protein
MDDTKHITAMLEDIQSTVKGLAEGLSNLRQTVNHIEQSVEALAPDANLIATPKTVGSDPSEESGGRP